MDAVRFWDEALQGWAIPEEILAAAPEQPFRFSRSVFDRFAEEALDKHTPSRRLAAEALRPGGGVLDIGCGGGAASMPHAATAGLVVGVDAQADMLEAFAARAAALGVTHAEIEGVWPQVAERAPELDVVACHHVLYNVRDIAAFVGALTAHARRRVVCELTAVHPLAGLTPLWQRFHGLERPERPTAEDAAAAVSELGLPVHVEAWDAPSLWLGRTAELAAFARRHLCLPEQREPEVAAALADAGLPHPRRRLVALWWDR